MLQFSQANTMTQNPESGVDLSLWTPLMDVPAQQRPPKLWRWLAHEGSLTEELRIAAGDAFHVRVLEESQVCLNSEDAGLLKVSVNTRVRNRQVYLCAQVPWVYAHTLVPLQSEHWLKQLGSRPLGERVFTQADTRRGPIEVAHLHPGHALYRLCVIGLTVAPPRLWARRSVLSVDNDRLLIYECFLPGMSD